MTDFSNIMSEIQYFEKLITNLRGQLYTVEKTTRYAYRILPNSSHTDSDQGKSLAITFMAITHGNEIAGIRVLNRFLEMLNASIINLSMPIGLVLGNYEAAQLGYRFVEKDMNRSFGVSSPSTLDAQRAKEIEPLLADSHYFIDFHQTIEKTSTPFWIFPYTRENFGFMQGLNIDIPVVTHWGDVFSKEGCCSDEFVNKSQGVALSIELGQKGFSVTQEVLGLYVMMRSLKYLSGDKNSAESSLVESHIYTWGEVIPYPSGDAALDEGWYNFRNVEKDQRLGSSSEGEIRSKSAGPVLFPKYGVYEALNRPTEICRILRKVSIDELGKVE